MPLSSLCLVAFSGDEEPPGGLFFMDVKNLAKVACFGFLPAEEGNEDDMNSSDLGLERRKGVKVRPASDLRM